MLFSSLSFLFVFLPCVYFGYFILKRIAPKRIEVRNIFLLCISLIFYAWGEPKNIIFMLCSIIANYFFAQSKKKIVFIFAVIFNLAFLCVFKYADFFIQNINILFRINIKAPHIALPIGISFYTFQALSYIIDVFRKKAEPQKNILNLGLYISLFPQLIAGPIVRYTDIESEIVNRTENFENFIGGLTMFMYGLAAKVILANNLASFADSIYADTAAVPTAVLYLAAISYSFQIYFDFAGYSLMAIGIGKSFGFHFPENFHFPYSASSITNFWRRWHITLSSWFRDYVYIPLGGNRVSPLRHIAHILITWLLTGLWHGASWNFVLWGLYYAVFLIAEKYCVDPLLKKLRGKATITGGKILRRLASLLVILFAWVIFRLTDISELSFVLKRMLFISREETEISVAEFFIEHADVCSKLIFLIPAVLCSFPFIKNIYAAKHKSKLMFALGLFAAFCFFIISVALLIGSTYNPFIYFRF